MSKSKQVDARTTLGQKIRERFKNYCRFYSDGYGTFNSPWFLEAIAEQPTFLKKIKKWLELEYKIWFEPRTNSPKCPTPLSRIQWHLRYAVPNLISDKWSSFKRGRKQTKSTTKLSLILIWHTKKELTGLICLRNSLMS